MLSIIACDLQTTLEAILNERTKLKYQVILCNVESISTFIFILGFRVVCATCGRQVQRPEFILARSKQVMVTRGVRFGRNGHFTGIFLCILHGFVPGKPTSSYYMNSSLPIPMNFLPQKLQNVKLVCQQW